MKSSILGRTGLGAAGLALLMLGACGGGEDSPNQPTSEERRKLDDIAAKAEESETFDTSADSLVLNEAALDEPAGTNAQAPADAPANTAGQR